MAYWGRIPKGTKSLISSIGQDGAVVGYIQIIDSERLGPAIKRSRALSFNPLVCPLKCTHVLTSINTNAEFKYTNMSQSIYLCFLKAYIAIHMKTQQSEP